MTFFLGMLATFAFLAWSLMLLVVGFLWAAEDARDRLTGKKDIDEFWRKRGMK